MVKDHACMPMVKHTMAAGLMTTAMAGAACFTVIPFIILFNSFIIFNSDLLL